MKKMMVLLVIFVSVLLSGCSQIRYSCNEDDDVLIPFYGNDDTMFNGINIGALNQCNDEINTSDEVKDKIEELSNRKIAPLEPSLDSPMDIYNTYEAMLIDGGLITLDDLLDYNGFQDIDVKRDSNKNGITRSLDLRYFYFETLEEEGINFNRFGDSIEQELSLYINDDYLYSTTVTKEIHEATEINPEVDEITTSQFRFSFANDHVIWDMFSTSTYNAHSEFKYTIFEEDIKYISMEYRYIETEEYSGSEFIYIEYDFVEEVYSAVKFDNVFNFSRYRIEFGDKNEQEKYYYIGYKNPSEDESYHMEYQHYKNDEFVVGISLPQEGTNTSNCTAVTICNNASVINYNIEYLDGWDGYGKSATSTSNVFYKDGIELVFDNDETKQILKTSSEFQSEDITNANFNAAQHFQLSSSYLLTPGETSFNSPVEGITFNEITYSDLLSKRNEKLNEILTNYILTDTEITYKGKVYDVEDFRFIYEKLIPESFSDYFKKQSSLD